MSASYVSDQPCDGPSCTLCGAAMTVSEYKCLSCGDHQEAAEIPEHPIADMFEVFKRLAGRWEDPEDASPLPWPWRT